MMLPFNGVFGWPLQCVLVHSPSRHDQHLTFSLQARRVVPNPAHTPQAGPQPQAQPQPTMLLCLWQAPEQLRQQLRAWHQQQQQKLLLLPLLRLLRLGRGRRRGSPLTGLPPLKPLEPGRQQPQPHPLMARKLSSGKGRLPRQGPRWGCSRRRALRPMCGRLLQRRPWRG